MLTKTLVLVVQPAPPATIAAIATTLATTPVAASVATTTSVASAFPLCQVPSETWLALLVVVPAC